MEFFHRDLPQSRCHADSKRDGTESVGVAAEPSFSSPNGVGAATPTPSPMKKSFSNTNWPRFFIVQGSNPEYPITRLHPFAIQKAIKGMVGDVKDAKKLRNDLLFIEVDRRSHAISLMNTTQLASVPVVVSPHRTLNSSKGVIHCNQLKYTNSENEVVNMTDEEILNELKDQDVIKVQRIISKQNNNKIPTDSFILTFDTPKIPSCVKVGWINCKTRLYIPNPLRCFNCQKFGHSSNKCSHASICAKCAQAGHQYNDCTNDAQCANCKQNHPASSRNCPTWKIQRQIMEIKCVNNITFKEAENRYNQQNSPLQRAVSEGTASSYSAVAASAMEKTIAMKDVQIQQLKEENKILKSELGNMKKHLTELQLAFAAFKSGFMPGQTAHLPVSKPGGNGIQDESVDGIDASLKRSRRSSSSGDEDNSSSLKVTPPKQVKACKTVENQDSPEAREGDIVSAPEEIGACASEKAEVSAFHEQDQRELVSNDKRPYHGKVSVTEVEKDCGPQAHQERSKPPPKPHPKKKGQSKKQRKTGSPSRSRSRSPQKRSTKPVVDRTSYKTKNVHMGQNLPPNVIEWDRL